MVTYGTSEDAEVQAVNLQYNKDILELPEGLNRNIKLMYELIGNPDIEVYIRDWTFLSLNKAIEIYNPNVMDLTMDGLHLQWHGGKGSDSSEFYGHQSDDEDSDINASNMTTRSTSASPVDDLVTKIEEMLFRLKLPKSTVHWKDTFRHLMPKEVTTTTSAPTSVM